MAGRRARVRATEAALGSGGIAGQFQQRQRVTPGFGDDPFANAVVHSAAHDRVQQGA
jgi:hypothetical protein